MKLTLLLALFAGWLCTPLVGQNSTCPLPSGAMQQPNSPVPTCFPGHTGPNSGSLTQFYTFVATQPTMAINLTPILGTSCSFPNTGINYSNLQLYKLGDCTNLYATGAYFTTLVTGVTYVWGVTMTPQDPTCVWIAEACPRVLEITVPLHLTLEGFAAKSADSAVELEWALSNEEAFTGFSLLRKATGETSFSPIGYISIENGEPHLATFHYTDAEAPAGLAEYQLWAYHKSGEVFQSDKISIEVQQETAELPQLSPNPVQESCQLQIPTGFGETTQAILLDSQGQRQVVTSGSAEAINAAINKRLPHLQPGLYFLHLSNSHKSSTLRLLKQ